MAPPDPIPSYGCIQNVHMFVRSYLLNLMPNLSQTLKQTLRCVQQSIKVIIVAIAAEMPEVILAKYGLLLRGMSLSQ